MADQEWLEQLKAGDEVDIYGGGRTATQKATVTRTTKTQIIIGEARYDVDRGYRRGNRNHWAEWINRPDLAERSELVKKVRREIDYSWDSRVTTDELRQIASILEAAKSRAERKES